MLQHDSHISGAPVVDRLACGSMLQAPRHDAARHQLEAPAGALAGGAVSGLASASADAPSPAISGGPVCPRYAAEPTVDTRVISAWGMNGRMWNLTHKFGPFDHSQRWRCAT